MALGKHTFLEWFTHTFMNPRTFLGALRRLCFRIQWTATRVLPTNAPRRSEYSSVMHQLPVLGGHVISRHWIKVSTQSAQTTCLQFCTSQSSPVSNYTSWENDHVTVFKERIYKERTLRNTERTSEKNDFSVIDINKYINNFTNNVIQKKEKDWR